VIGFIGRRPDNKGIRWLKQQVGESAITTKSWLYGIDKAYRFIKHYRTVILVEGIFDYFAFYRLLQDQ
jgi:DNA primase